MQIRPYESEDEAGVIALWQRCGLTRPWNNPRKDIQRKLAVRPELFLVGISDGQIVATVMAGYEGHRGWINYLGVDPAQQRKGWGRALMAEAERLLADAGCPKINLQVRTTNTAVIEFYRSLGYAVDDVVSLGKRLEQDGPMDDTVVDDTVVTERIVFTGRVQGVGFRVTTAQLAEGHPITGYVRNQADGSVELVASGTQPAIDALVQRIAASFAGYIRATDRAPLETAAPFQGFVVRH